MMAAHVLPTPSGRPTWEDLVVSEIEAMAARLAKVCDGRGELVIHPKRDVRSRRNRPPSLRMTFRFIWPFKSHPTRVGAKTWSFAEHNLRTAAPSVLSGQNPRPISNPSLSIKTRCP